MSERKISRRQLRGIGGAAAGATFLGGLPAAASPLQAAPAGLPQVPRRTLGKTGQKVPILLLGGAAGFDPRFDPKIAEALRFGVNYIDAADCYSNGRCEPSVA